MLYFCYEIYYAYLISKRELCFLFVVLECLYLIHLGGAGGCKKIRSGVKVGACVCVRVSQL